MAIEPVSALLDIGGKLIDRLWPDPAQRDAAKLELFKLQQSGELAVLAAETDLQREQIRVNAEEAKNPSLFVSGWRPALGWICVSACGWNWVGLSVINTAAALFQHPVNLRPADLSEMLPILIGILGLGTLRTIEKARGVARP